MLDENEKQKAHNQGQYDYSSTKDAILGPRHSVPWPKLFEPHEDWEERVRLYEEGLKNAADMDDR